MKIIRFVVAVVICTLLVFSTMSPATAAGRSQPTHPTEGSSQMNRLQDRSEDVVNAEPRSMKDVQGDSSGGKLNEVQGDADRDKMYRSKTSQQTESFRDKAEDVLENITGNR